MPRDERSIDHIIPMWRYDGEYWWQQNWQMLCKNCCIIKGKIEGKP